MGKRKKGRSLPKPKPNPGLVGNDDEIDEFHKQRNKILLNKDDDALLSSESEQDEEIYGLNDVSSDEEEEEGEENEDEEDQDEDEEEVKDNRWGKSKKTFYSADDIDNDEEADEEEEEALRLQSKKMNQLDEADFDDESTFNVRTGEKKAKKIGDSSEADRLVKQINKELDSIDFDDEEVENVVRNISKLSKDEKLEIIANESPELLELLDDFKSSVDEVRNTLLPILERTKSGNLVTEKGVSFLEVKFHLLLTYCINISFYLLMKVEGISVKDHPVIDQLVQIRTILDKLKPLDLKLKYQIEKLLKIANTGISSVDSGNPRNFKPNLESMIDQDEDEVENKDVYKAAPLAEAQFDEYAGSKEKKVAERARQKANRSNMMKFIASEYSETPTEETTIGSLRGKTQIDEERLHREQYEEDMFLRLQETKKDRNKRKQKLRDDDLRIDVLDSFDDFARVSKKNDDVDKFLESKTKSLRDFNKRKSDDKEDDLYEQTKRKKQRVKQQKEDDYEIKKMNRNFRSDEVEEGEKRKITRDIESNRGLTRQRNKETKTPRMRMKKKYENAKKKQRGMTTKMADRSVPYGGEMTGVKKNVVRSKSLRD